MLTTALALVFACVVFSVCDQVILRRDLFLDPTTTAEMTGFNGASALSFNDPCSAEQTLKSIAAHPQLTGACVYGRDSAIFTNYHRAAKEPWGFPERLVRLALQSTNAYNTSSGAPLCP